MDRLTTKSIDGVKIILPGLQIPYTIQEIADHYRGVLDDVANKLSAYEEAELPCKVGDIVYNIIPSRNIISTMKIISIHISECSRLYGWELIDGIYGNLNGFEEMAIGKTVFLNYETAEAALKASA